MNEQDIPCVTCPQCGTDIALLTPIDGVHWSEAVKTCNAMRGLDPQEARRSYVAMQIAQCYGSPTFNADFRLYDPRNESNWISVFTRGDQSHFDCNMILSAAQSLAEQSKDVELLRLLEMLK
jgi:hypothetical protein